MGTWSLRSYISPGQLIVISVITTICMGAAALSLDYARSTAIPLIDLFFTATSAVCVTGLSTVPFSTFTPFGQTILLLLIQIGGLGLITITLFFMYLLVNIGLSGSVIASQILEIESWREVRKTLIMIMLFTLFCELIGSLGLYWLVRPTHGGYEGAFFALFHAISAFCNAGIVLPSDIIHTYGLSPFFLTIIGLLMLSGGIGFFTWYEIGKMFILWFQKKRFRFSLHSALTLKISLALITATTAAYLLLEQNHSLQEESSLAALCIALFHAISFRSAGFLMVHSIFILHPATLLLLFLIAFIGSGAGSTGSGIKITTFAIFMAAVKSAITGRDEVEIAHRTIPHDQVYKAIAILSLSLSWILISTFILLITEPDHTFGDLLFESISAFSCLGISADVTPTLSFVGKIVVMTSMIAGRIGSLTVLLSLKTKTLEDTQQFSYPEERVLLG